MAFQKGATSIMLGVDVVRWCFRVALMAPTREPQDR
jgi:hypothetical protein